MNEIRDIVQTIVKGCKRAGIEVSEVLAAFTAQTVIETNEKSFVMDRQVTPDTAQQVILASIEKLIEQDNPALETIKMQVDYDSLSLDHENESRRIIYNRNKMVANQKQAIIDTEMVDSNDFTTLTGLYRKIFKYLMEFSPNMKPTHDKQMDREIAASLESVFPRVGLKAFIMLSPDEKALQLNELGRIILGIRLFNREQNRGGAGLENMDKDSVKLVTTMADEISNEITYFNDACMKYQHAVVKAHLYRKKYDEAVAILNTYEQHYNNEENRRNQNKKSSDQLPNEFRDMYERQRETVDKMALPISDTVIDRWSQELTNRRQYLGYLKVLHEEISVLKSKIFSLNENIQLELRNLKAVVTNRSSVPKEVVYPRFDALGNFWVKLYEDITVLISHSKTYKILSKYRLSFTPTLSEKDYESDEALSSEEVPSLMQLMLQNANITQGITSSGEDNLDEEKQKHDSISDAISVDGTIGSKPTIDTSISMTQEKPDIEFQGSKQDQEDNQSQTSDKENFTQEKNQGKRAHHGNQFEYDSTRHEGQSMNDSLMQLNARLADAIADKSVTVAASGAVLLSVENTPDFMYLPLELQGFCPWTIVHARGLLIPGKPNLGIVRYNNQYFVFDHNVALSAFMNDPEFYLFKIKERAMKNPEYIHLLRLQKWFPKTSIMKLLEQQIPESDGALITYTKQSHMKDASTSTPTHFIESYIDINYFWNEWELRRNALKIINLKSCITTSSQTDDSNFRRDNATQIYLPKDNDTQTRKDHGTNPPRVTTFVAGLRGKVNAVKDGQISKYMKPSKLPPTESITSESIKGQRNAPSNDSPTASPSVSRKSVNDKFDSGKMGIFNIKDMRPHVIRFETDI